MFLTCYTGTVHDYNLELCYIIFSSYIISVTMDVQEASFIPV